MIKPVKKLNLTSFCKHLFIEMPIVGIMRNVAIEDIFEILPLYHKAGLTTLEVTMNSTKAEEMINYAVQEYGNRLNIGAGTVCTMGHLRKALNAGAQFIVTPIINSKVIKECNALDIPIFPGAFTPTEIFKAWQIGANMVKVFPSGILGSKYIKEVLAPLNDIELLATGGINLDNINDYLQAGVKGLGIGTPLFNKEFIKNKDWDKLFSNFKQFEKKVREFKAGTDNEN
jgi:2-dehydro-3-deoxyphosphogluconate aldolase/(4S)-4-hydroxy-2-oxoglutarate aldolase